MKDYGLFSYAVEEDMKRRSVLIAWFLALSMLLPACAPARPDCTKEEIFCVGMVTDVGKINDRGFNQSAWRGVQQAQEELGALVQYIETSDTRDYAKNIATFADEDYDVIVTVGFNLREATRAAAEMYPDIKFIGVDQDQFEGEMENVAGLIFPEDHAGFLVGALASMMSETHMVGAVCASDDIPPVWRLGEGYKAGAAYADELTGIATNVLVLYHNDVSFDTTFVDPEWGAASTEAMEKAWTLYLAAAASPGTARWSLRRRRVFMRSASIPISTSRFLKRHLECSRVP